MPWYKTGRQREVVLDITIDGRWALPVTSGGSEPEPNTFKYLYGSIRIADIFPAFVEASDYVKDVTPAGHSRDHRHFSTGVQLVAHVGTASATAIMYDWDAVPIANRQWSQWDMTWSCYGSIVVPTAGEYGDGPY